jgi:nitrogen regulatory protein P-II 1
MKLIRSVIDPAKIDEVKAALREIDVAWLTMTQVSDHTPLKKHTITWRGHQHEVGAWRVEVDVAVDDDDVDKVVDVIIRSARTGQLDDGYISVIPVDHRYEIRTGRRSV